MKRFNVLYILGLLILSIFCSAWGYYPQIVISDDTIYMPMSIIVIPNTFEKAKEAGKIAKYDSQNNTLSTDYIIDDSNRCSVKELSLDHTSTRLAFHGSCYISQENYYYKITVIDLKTRKVLTTFDKGFSFSFSPQGNAIVYTEKSPSSDNSGYTTNVWIYSFNTNLKKKFDMKISAIDINWSEHDGNIYVTNYYNVSRYNVSTGEVENVSHKGIYFSPDGRYAVARGYEDSSRIFRTSDGFEMKMWEKLILGKEISEDGSPPFIHFRMWSNKLNSVIFSADGKGNVIFNVKQEKVIGVFPQGILGANADGTQIAVRTYPNKEGPPKIEILNLLDLVNKSGSPQ